ncbi:MAG: hypothetical protein C5S48_09455 [Candidatus Methanogaster sp.]|nr:MAG: hypothetical protein C5S48_09455 [ANME-2 cluster archaeon]
MTAEIAIIKKEAIAIAADSAVTLREEKIVSTPKRGVRGMRASIYLNLVL